MAAPSRDGPKPPINRQTTTPFHLKLFYRVGNFHSLSDYRTPAPSRHRGGPLSGPNAIRAPSPPATAPLPHHLEIYTWQSCTLRELSQLLTSALPSLLPNSPVGTRLCFRLIYPDARAAAMAGPDVRAGRYVTRELGSVVVAPRDGTYRTEKDAHDLGESTPRPGPLRFQGGEADKSLQDARFIIGDYVECAVLPPLDDGSIAPPPRAGLGPPQIGGGMRAFGQNGSGRSGRGGRGDRDRGGPNLPMGDWRRGERLPEGGMRGGGRRGWNPY
ncbi:Sin3 associated polypeptide p18 [Penicillium verhagenii]|nr:Sin3 associated polypeptide p18 [Penicillium verhagenii]